MDHKKDLEIFDEKLICYDIAIGVIFVTILNLFIQADGLCYSRITNAGVYFRTLLLASISYPLLSFYFYMFYKA